MRVACIMLSQGDTELERAVGAQVRPPEQIGTTSGGLGAQAPWLWVLDGTALPRADALARLLAAAERLEGIVSPVLLASQIVGADGRLAPGHVPLVPQGQTIVQLRTAALRVLHVRAVSGGSLLVRREAAGRLPADGPGRAMAWTATVLRGGGGFVVPGSVADLRRPGSPGDGAHRVRRLLFGRGLQWRERLRLVAEVVERGGADRI